jgi:hypothetical protein
MPSAPSVIMRPANFGQAPKNQFRVVALSCFRDQEFLNHEIATARNAETRFTSTAF